MPVLITFVGSLLLPVGYLAAVTTGLIDWRTWLPVALLSGFVSWLAAIRINEGGSTHRHAALEQSLD